ncbi:MAG: transcription termination/antitermination protein NusA [Caldisericia bacterium]|nr:transcription termination/antitermination protein NusA [Caldisericia bacterium]
MPAGKIFQAIDLYCKEREIKKKDAIYEAIEAGILAAYKKAYGTIDNIRVVMNPHMRILKVIEERQVVISVEDEHKEVSLPEAKTVKPDIELGDLIDTELNLGKLDRILADVVKQVVMQHIHKNYQDEIFDEFKAREHSMVMGEISKITSSKIYVKLSKAEGVLPFEEQMKNEKYRVGNTIHCYIFYVYKSRREPMIMLSRTHPNLLKCMMELEIPELAQGLIEVKKIVREPGSRAKVAVYSTETKIDPVGTCIGTKGSRINAVGKRLNGEKIDVIRWNENIQTYIANSLSPAKVERDNVTLDEENHLATVYIANDYFSLAIGQRGLNVKLAARLTSYKLDVLQKSENNGQEN